jgi:Glycosyltransferase family 87
MQIKPWTVMAICSAGIAIIVLLFWPPIWGRVIKGDNDFQHFYVSGQLVLQGKLYNTQAFRLAQTALSGHVIPSFIASSRPPFFAAAFVPFARLPYRVAWVIWVGLLVGATIGFVCLWPDRRAAILAVCWSGGLSASLANGQDLPLILLWVAIALRIWKRHPFLAGLLFSLCATKFHLFVFVPLLLWRHKLWRGFLVGAVGLLAISFIAAGLDWPQQYLAILSQSAIHPDIEHMPNFHGFFIQWPHASIWELSASCVVAIVVFVVVRRTDFTDGLAVILLAGLLVSHHAYLADCTLLLPALLIALRTLRGGFMIPVIWLVLPVSALSLLLGGPLGDITRLAIVSVFTLMAWQSYVFASQRRIDQAESCPSEVTRSPLRDRQDVLHAGLGVRP